MICILVEDKTGVTVWLYCYHKSGLVPSTPSSKFRDNSLWDSGLLLLMVVKAFPCLVLSSSEGYALNYVSCFLLDSSCIWCNGFTILLSWDVVDIFLLLWTF